MNVKWYYRQSEVPDSVYQHLVQDRNNENGETAFSCTETQLYKLLVRRLPIYTTHIYTHTLSESKYIYLLCNITLNFSPSETHTHTHTTLPLLSRLLGDIRASCELHFKQKPDNSVPGGRTNPVALCCSPGNTPSGQTAALSSINNLQCHVALEHTRSQHH